MHYIITGSLGHISKPLTTQLIAAGHNATVISSREDNRKEIESLGANAAIGSVNDPDFLTRTFTDADAVYLMVPNDMSAPGILAHQKSVGDNYMQALRRSGVKNAILLSSIGAHLGHGAGPIDGLAYLERQLSKIDDLNVKILRPSYFFYNLHAMGGMVRQAGIMGSNFDGTIALTHTDDIADVAAKHLLANDSKGQTVEYIVSDERTSAEIAGILGSAIGRPETPWLLFSDEDELGGMIGAGLSKDIAERYVEMGKGMREGRIQEDFRKNKPANYGKVKLEDFAKEFAAAYAQG